MRSNPDLWLQAFTDWIAGARPFGTTPSGLHAVDGRKRERETEREGESCTSCPISPKVGRARRARGEDISVMPSRQKTDFAHMAQRDNFKQRTSSLLRHISEMPCCTQVLRHRFFASKRLRVATTEDSRTSVCTPYVHQSTMILIEGTPG